MGALSTRTAGHGLVAVFLLAAIGVLVAGCGGGGGGSSAPSLGHTIAPDFSLEDENPSSLTFETVVSPRDYLGYVIGVYFAHAGCGYCQSQFARLDELQQQLINENADTIIRLIGVNAAGHEGANDGITPLGDIPWLQDVHEQEVWQEWEVTLRDVVILDPDNKFESVYNLTEHDLNQAENRSALIALLKTIAHEQ